MKRLGFAVIAAAACLCGTANATTLVDLVNAPSQAGTPFSFNLIATSGTTTISFAGYNVTNDEYVQGIALTDAGGNNVLGTSWTFTAASSSQAGVNGAGSDMLFEGNTDGSYDTYSQTVATAAAAAYTLAFNFSNYASVQNGLRVTTSAQLAAAPEPGSWALMVIGFGAAGTAMRVRRKALRLS